MKEIKKTLDIYFDLKDKLEEFTSDYHDDIYWDCVGYYEDLEELNQNDLDTIQENIVIFNKIKKELAKKKPDFEKIFLLEQGIEYTYC